LAFNLGFEKFRTRQWRGVEFVSIVIHYPAQADFALLYAELSEAFFNRNQSDQQIH